MKCTTFWEVLNEFPCIITDYYRSPHESQKTKKADLAPKTNPNPNFESRFGFLVKFCLFPELGFKISGLELKKMNLYPFFFHFWTTVHGFSPKKIKNGPKHYKLDPKNYNKSLIIIFVEFSPGLKNFLAAFWYLIISLKINLK